MEFVNGSISENKLSEKEDLILKLKTDFIFLLLGLKGVNLQEFVQSELYNNECFNMLIENIYNKLKGIDLSYEYCTEHPITHRTAFGIFPIFRNNNHKIDLQKLNITYYDSILTIEDNEVCYKYSIIDGKLCQNGSNQMFQKYIINAPEIDIETAIRAKKQFHKDLKSYRERTEEALDRSYEFSKDFRVK